MVDPVTIASTPHKAIAALYAQEQAQREKSWRLECEKRGHGKLVKKG